MPLKEENLLLMQVQLENCIKIMVASAIAKELGIGRASVYRALEV